VLVNSFFNITHSSGATLEMQQTLGYTRRNSDAFIIEVKLAVCGFTIVVVQVNLICLSECPNLAINLPEYPSTVQLDSSKSSGEFRSHFACVSDRSEDLG
jgi:hypothetical protein